MCVSVEIKNWNVNKCLELFFFINDVDGLSMSS